MRLFLQNILSSKIWFFVVLLVIVAALVSFLIGFRIVYPLWIFKNDWESISAVGTWGSAIGTWFSVVSTTILTVLIIRQTNNNASAQRELEKNIANKQAAQDELNRNISLFDKRFAVYNLLVQFIKNLHYFSQLKQNFRTNNTEIIVKPEDIFLFRNGKTQAPLSASDTTAKNVDILNTSEFLFKTDAGVLIKAFAGSYLALVQEIEQNVTFHEASTSDDKLKQAVADYQKLEQSNTLEHIKTLLDISSLK